MLWQVIFCVDLEGRQPVKDFSLAQPKSAIIEIIHVFKLLREFNVGLGMPFVKKIDKSGLRELRIKHSSNIYRIFYFAFVGEKFILLHAILKKQTQTPEQDLRIALKRRHDYAANNADDKLPL